MIEDVTRKDALPPLPEPVSCAPEPALPGVKAGWRTSEFGLTFLLLTLAGLVLLARSPGETGEALVMAAAVVAAAIAVAAYTLARARLKSTGEGSTMAERDRSRADAQERWRARAEVEAERAAARSSGMVERAVPTKEP